MAIEQHLRQLVVGLGVVEISFHEEITAGGGVLVDEHVVEGPELEDLVGEGFAVIVGVIRDGVPVIELAHVGVGLGRGMRAALGACLGMVLALGVGYGGHFEEREVGPGWGCV